ncbi:ankyrin repeat domain-containing protein [Gordonia hankookensis]|uniref:ankyrin repeat domain-containing protein n=1 Tax=Gordonia hankookensis TaxID=589403 RepID=UPI001CBB2AE7|nr:ankyrin repeat domain-containing protein [Gordonia hankookensis]
MAPTGDPMDRDDLHYAALENEVDQVKSLLALGVSPDVRDKADWTPSTSRRKMTLWMPRECLSKQVPT